jgi:hypothetical protein
MPSVSEALDSIPSTRKIKGLGMELSGRVLA